MIKKVLEYFNKLWYSNYSSIGELENMKEVKGIFEANELAKYINYKYLQLPNRITKTISPLKLQKSLYFCFAYWGAFVYCDEKKQSELSLNYSKYLFGERIEAWVYGPVIPDVYHSKEYLNECNPEEMFKGKEYVREFIDDILNDTLKISDFKLVEISHKDNCWKHNFREKDLQHNKEINKDEIIREYANEI